MANSVKVFIGGKEYSLSGENPEMIKQTASLVNKQIENLVTTHGDLPDKSIPFLLAALNIAENDINKTNELITLTDEITTEFKKMTDSLVTTLNSWY